MSTAIYQLNYGCNQNCQFCLNEWRGKSMAELDSSRKELIIRKLNELGVTKLIISGGEPILDKDFKKLVLFAHNLGMKLLIQTNGTLINDEMAEFLKGKAILEISLEGTEEIHNRVTRSNNFQKAISGIKTAINHGIPVCTNFTITKANLGCLDDYVKLIENLKIPLANFTRMYHSGNAIVNINLMPNEKEHLDFLRKIPKLQYDTGVILNIQPGFKEDILKAAGIISYNRCHAGRELSISPGGSVKACPSWPVSYGNILDDFKMPEITSKGCAIEDLVEAKVNKRKMR